MDKSQFQPPRTEHSVELYRQIEQSYASNVPTPEKSRAPFQFFKDIDNVVDSFRDTVVATEHEKGRTVKMKYVPFSLTLSARPANVIIKELINKEREYFFDEEHSPFKEKGKYTIWKGAKNDSLSGDKDISDWYVEEIIPNNPGKGPIVHVETHPKHVKIFNHAGQAVPVTIADLKMLILLTKNYVEDLMNMEEYEFEKNRAEVIFEETDILEHIEMLLPPEPVDGRKSDFDLTA